MNKPKLRPMYSISGSVTRGIVAPICQTITCKQIVRILMSRHCDLDIDLHHSWSDQVLLLATVSKSQFIIGNTIWQKIGIANEYCEFTRLIHAARCCSLTDRTTITRVKQRLMFYLTKYIQLADGSSRHADFHMTYFLCFYCTVLHKTYFLYLLLPRSTVLSDSTR